MPVCNHSRLPVNQSVLRTSSSVWTEPSAMPPATAIGIDLQAADERGGQGRHDQSAVSPTGVIVPPMGPTTITASVPSTDAMTQLMAASFCGEYPRSTAPFSLPAAARVARPKRVNR